MRGKIGEIMYERLLKCEDCGESFWHTIERRSDPNPDECPVCHNSGEPILQWKSKPKLSPKIAAMIEEGRGPSISQAYAKSGDSVYRAAEESSVARSHMAAQELGCDPSETKHMIVTDMNDNMRPGDTAARLPPNPVTEAMAQGKNTGFQQTPVAPTGQVLTGGGFGGAGEVVRQGITAKHAGIQNRLVREGQLARHVAK